MDFLLRLLRKRKGVKAAFFGASCLLLMVRRILDILLRLKKRLSYVLVCEELSSGFCRFSEEIFSEFHWCRGTAFFLYQRNLTDVD